MLSRVADNLYWMNRYLERAEHTARILVVNLSQMLDETQETAELRWDRVLESLSQEPVNTADAYAIAGRLTFDREVPASILSCIAGARENARQVREQISSEMWEQLNRLFHTLNTKRMSQTWRDESYDFYHGVVKDSLHEFQGVTEATLNRSEGWHFMQLGRFIERAINTVKLLDAHFIPDGSALGYVDLSYLEWVGLLRSCTSLESYTRVYSASLRPERVAEYMLLNEASPRSMRFAADRINESILAITAVTGQRRSARVKRLAGRLQAQLDYGTIDEIMEDGIHTHLRSVRRQCEQIHSGIYQCYINSVEAPIIA